LVVVWVGVIKVGFSPLITFFCGRRWFDGV